MNYIVLDLEWNQSYRGKEYSIEETDDAADHTGTGQDGGAFQERMFLDHKHKIPFFLIYIRRKYLTERKCGAIFEANPSETLGINPENGAAIRRISDFGMKQYGRAA